MSALPEKAHTPRQVHNYLSLPIQRTDDVLMTDEEMFQLKGGMNAWYAKFFFSLGMVSSYLLLSGRAIEFMRFNIKGSTFLKCNVVFFMAYNFYRVSYNTLNGLTHRIDMHHNALLFRALCNYETMMANKKKPTFH